MDDSADDNLSRRQFIKTAAAQGIVVAGAGSLISGCGTRTPQVHLPDPSAAQKAGRRQSDSPIFVSRCDQYADDIFSALLKKGVSNIDLPDLKGKTVLIKPNMVDYWPDRPITTNPAVVKAAVDLVDYLGAREIIIGEAPGHMRDTELLLNTSGLGALVKKLGLRFVDLNLDDIEPVSNTNGFSPLKQIYLPKTALHADAVVSVPKLKTHHWARITCSMKNLYGCVPGRKYGWPKNILHFSGIDNCILDLNMLLKPAIQVVDAVVAMEGDGPLNGTPKQSNFIMVGTDAPAVDSTCARAMGIDPKNVPYLRVAGEVIGNIDPTHIKLFGVDQMATLTTPFKPSPNFNQAGNPLTHGDPNMSGS
jgi:uncharacterized protein (DUF362 family)